jgi:hypothetical protein
MIQSCGSEFTQETGMRINSFVASIMSLFLVALSLTIPAVPTVRANTVTTNFGCVFVGPIFESECGAFQTAGALSGYVSQRVGAFHDNSVSDAFVGIYCGGVAVEIVAQAWVGSIGNTFASIRAWSEHPMGGHYYIFSGWMEKDQYGEYVSGDVTYPEYDPWCDVSGWVQ